MVAYSFKRRFVAPIRAGLGLIGMGKDHQGKEVPCELVLDDGETKPRLFDPELDLDPPITPKRQTIRVNRTGKNRHANPGETLQLYCDMRTKQCFKIGEARCISVQTIKILFAETPKQTDMISVERERPICEILELDNFARSDGFLDWNEMLVFWGEEHGLAPFYGVLIRWEPLP